MTEVPQVTSSLLWRAAAVAAAIDLPLLVVVGSLVSPASFRRLKWSLVAAASLLYAVLWFTFGSVTYWDAVYSHVFPAWSRWLLPLWFGVLFGGVALLFWAISVRSAGWPAVWFALLGGLVSLVGHGIGISRGLMRVPMLAQASAASALAFGVFEFVFYWSVIVGLAVGARHAGRALGLVKAA
jgi:hypothetical protein